jgi:acetate kinase
MKVLVINAGSSSLKYQLIDMTDESVLAKGNCERIGTDGAFIGFKTSDGQKIERETEMKSEVEYEYLQRTR